MQHRLNLLFIDPKEHKKALHSVYEVGIQGATIVYGRGTISNKFLAALGMDQLRKEVMLCVSDNSQSHALQEALMEQLNLEKHGHGIVVSLPLCRVKGLVAMNQDFEEDDMRMGFEMITIIVDNGRADDVIDAAREAGATGATVLHGRGSGAEKKERFFNLDIEPEKEVVLIVVENSQAGTIIAKIEQVIDFSMPNSGILFSLRADEVSGLYRE